MALTSDRTRLSEREFLQQIRDLARVFGWLCYHTHDSRRSEAGFPDLVLVKASTDDRPGNIIFAELKADRGRLTPAQRVWLEALGACPGVEAYVWRPADWDAIVSRLQMRHIVGFCDMSWHAQDGFRAQS
jgi:hypothetical protein